MEPVFADLEIPEEELFEEIPEEPKVEKADNQNKKIKLKNDLESVELKTEKLDLNDIDAELPKHLQPSK